MKLKNPFHRLVQYYLLDMKLQSKFLVLHLILLLLPTFIISILFYGKIYNVIIDGTIYSEQSYTEQTAYSVEVMLSQIIRRMDSVLKLDLINDIFFTNPKEKQAVSLEKDAIENFEQAISGLTEDGLVSSIQIYYGSVYDGYFPDSAIFHPTDDIRGSYWYGIFSTQEEHTLLCPSLYLSPSSIEEHGDLAYIYRIPATDYTKEDMEAYAFIAVYFSQDMLNTILRKETTINASVSYIVNNREGLVSTSDKTLSGKYFMTQETLEESIGSPGNFVALQTKEGPIYSGYYKIPNSDWYMVSILSSKNLTQKGSNLVFFFLSLYFAFLLLGFFITYFLSRSIVQRIDSFIKQMGTVRHGKPVSYNEKYLAKDEIGDLVDSYNYMTNEIISLMDQQEQAAKDLRLSEFQALQAQINPHFLYNTLDMINWLALSDKNEEVSNAVQTLSKFYKLTLRKRDSIGPIEQELEHISLYTQIQNMRYDDQIELIIDVPHEITEYHIPKLTFQPIVENSISHGIFMKDEKRGTIVVTGWMEENDIVIQISDDGVGMEPDLVNSLLKGTNHSTKGSNVGVYNTHLRLQLLFGTNYGLLYESTLGQGTAVTIRLPALKDK